MCTHATNVTNRLGREDVRSHCYCFSLQAVDWLLVLKLQKVIDDFN